MMESFGGAFFYLFSLLYVLLIVFLLVLTYKFVMAHEKMADSMEDIARHLRNQNRNRP